ncbi:MAG TPA: DUF819 family protein [Phycisphaerales bacterium]|mgnify:CR=1 FL=1|nr:DUF819 family protein [Phycisphaerales bacterium]
MDDPVVTSPVGVLAVLAGIASFFLYLERKTQWRLFHYLPPIVFVYALPVIFSNTGLIPTRCLLFDLLGDVLLPMFLLLMLLDVDVLSAVRIMGKGIFVMLFGTAGVILGAPIAYWLVKNRLGPDAWKAFGALAGSWIGGTANMTAVAKGIGASDAECGLAIIADNLVYLIWIPVLIGSKNFSRWFHRFARVDEQRIAALERASGDLLQDKGPFDVRHFLYLLFLGLFFPWLATQLAGRMPRAEPILTGQSWKILWVTTFGILLSLTSAKRIPGSHQVAVAMVYLYVAKMGASADLRELADKAAWFILGAYVWIAVHGVLCLIGARLFRVDVHSTAIASAANIGGIASAPIVAACHNEKLVPVSVLMALIGYAIGNYGALAAATLCYWVSGW